MRYAADVNNQVDAVHERARQALLIGNDLSAGAATLFTAIAVEAAGAGVHRGDHHEVGGIRAMACDAADGDVFVLEGLAQRLEGGARVFRKLIEKEDAEMS